MDKVNCPLCRKPLDQDIQFEMFECASKSPGLFVVFPIVGGMHRLTVLNPSMLTPEIQDALVRIIGGDEIANAMLENRVLLEKLLDQPLKGE